MKVFSSKRHPSGYVSLLVVISTGTLLTLLTIYAYKRALAAHSVQSKSQLRVDYAEKEEAILRSIVAITPNRAIRAMQGGSDSNAGSREPMSWQKIFSDSLDMANSRTSISASLEESIGIANLRKGNAGDFETASTEKIFSSIIAEEGYVSAGLNRSLGTGYPASLSSADTPTSSKDFIYPIISDLKYDPLAVVGYGPQVGGRSKFGLLKYPRINFGYAEPGEDFVAKRNWWAFSMNVAANDADLTRLATSKRDYVLSIYEIPSQLAISADSFMSLGRFRSGEEWQNVTIDGGLFAGTAEVEGTGTTFNRLASRRGMTFGEGTTINGENFGSDPFAAGFREFYQTDPTKILPVSLASESGRAAFIPISRGKEVVNGIDTYPFFDRFANVNENNVLSSTSWNNYSSGAMQCAMRLTVTEVASSTDPTPTMLEFEYFLPNGTRSKIQMPQPGADPITTLPTGYIEIVSSENGSYNLSLLAGGQPVDVAYGINKGPGKAGFAFLADRTGTIRFDNATFGDPMVGEGKKGYWRKRAGTGLQELTVGSDPSDPKQKCIAIYPERMKDFLAAIGGAGLDKNHSLVVNVDYTKIGPKYPKRPTIPCTNLDYGLIMQESADLTRFTKGFSLVTNLRLYFGDDFNSVPGTPPAGYTPAVTATNPDGHFIVPTSIFAPEKRWGVDISPTNVSHKGQIGSLAQGNKILESDTLNVVSPLEAKNKDGTAYAPERIESTLWQIRHPAELPPINMMNWLVLLEERRSEYY